MGKELLKSYSQAGQDLWVLSQFPEGYKGTFLDIGCGTKDFYSNTWLLEQAGWTGTCIDNRPEVLQDGRSCEVIITDATKIDYDWLKPSYDYLSLDVDDATLSVLLKIPLKDKWFSYITIEHDYYRLGEELRYGERRYLHYNGYSLVKKDVEHNGLKFEDWWKHSTYA